MNPIDQKYLSDDDSEGAIFASEMIIEDLEFCDDGKSSSGRTTQSSVKLPPIQLRSQSSTSTPSSGGLSVRSTPKTAWDVVSNESNSPLPADVVRKAKEYSGQDELRRRALMVEQQKALTEYMILGSRANIADMSANGAIPPSVHPVQQTITSRRLPRLRREELSGIGISKSNSGYENNSNGGYNPTLFTVIDPVPARSGQLAPLPVPK